MNNLIESMERRKFDMSENLPSRLTQDPLSQKMYGTSSAFRPKDTNLNDFSTHKVPSDYGQKDYLQPSNVLRKPPRKEDMILVDNDELLRMLLIQACSL